ncbi:MAG: hypothetical protein JW774_02875 [Candidatus Aureabacteria bacterium]|nr:hypothetical protein [Candidatus Auribacterota bacterium]
MNTKIGSLIVNFACLACLSVYACAEGNQATSDQNGTGNQSVQTQTTGSGHGMVMIIRQNGDYNTATQNQNNDISTTAEIYQYYGNNNADQIQLDCQNNHAYIYQGYYNGSWYYASYNCNAFQEQSSGHDNTARIYQYPSNDSNAGQWQNLGHNNSATIDQIYTNGASASQWQDSSDTTSSVLYIMQYYQNHEALQHQNMGSTGDVAYIEQFSYNGGACFADQTFINTANIHTNILQYAGNALGEKMHADQTFEDATSCTAFIYQNGNQLDGLNWATQDIHGYGNSATIYQYGSNYNGISALQIQYGDQNTAYITQTGINNIADQEQYNFHDSATTLQNGNANNSSIFQQ